MVNELTPVQLRLTCNPKDFSFDTTADLEPLDRIIGQERAVEALKLGLGIKDAKNRYNIYVAGDPGTGKMSAVEYFLGQASEAEPQPPDLCYVHNFADPHAPRFLELPPGFGTRLRNDIDHLIDRLKRDIPQVFESDEFKARSKKINEQHSEKRSKLFDQMEDECREHGFAMQRTPIGINTLPLQADGEPLSQEEYEALSEKKRAKIREKQSKVQVLIQDKLQEINRVDEEREEAVNDLAKEAVRFKISPYFNQLKERYGEIDKADSFLDQMKDDIAEHIEYFKQAGNHNTRQTPFAMPQADPFKRYSVNVLVDNSDTEGAPVIVEQNATYTNIFGAVERRVQMGIMHTDFTMIKSGSLHRANGGYLVLSADNLFRRGLSWEALKIAIKRAEIHIEDPMQMLGYSSTEGLQPEPVPFRAKIIIIGSPHIYELLHHYDEDFAKLFSVKSDFGKEMERTPEHEQEIARFVRSCCQDDNGLLAFDPSGVAKMVEYSSDLSGDQKKLTCEFGNLTAIVKEASYWASADDSDHVTAQHVQLALDKRDTRHDRIDTKIREMIARDQILVDVDGEVTGQVNGLAVLQTGDFTFGKPSRITTSVYTGKDGIVDIEREAELGGKTHSKGILILKGFLGEHFARSEPLSLSAQVTFEQSYSKIDGDSASSTELYGLLSSLSDLPIKQGLAVTGSVNQKGEIQPIGGVNEKIEGFFKVCQAKDAIDGKQGVLIPARNVDNLMLSQEIVDAVDQGKFHIYPISTIQEGIKILIGVEAGERQEDGTYPEQTVFARASSRLDEIRTALKEEKKEKDEEGDSKDKKKKEKEDETVS